MFILALTPILFVLIGMIGLKKPAIIVTPLATVFTIIISVLFFNGAFDETVFDITNGLSSGVKMIFMIWSAFTMLLMMEDSKAMDKIKEVIANFTIDRRVQVVIIALGLGMFLEGAAGAGTPAAITAPFLVGLGFTPMLAVTAALVSNSVPVSWGGAGVTTIMGATPLADYMTIQQASQMVGYIHMFGGIILPTLLVLIIFGKKGLKGLMPYLSFTGLVVALSVWFISSFVTPEIVGMGSGVITITSSILYIKFIGVKTPHEYRYVPKEEGKSTLSSIKAFSPYLLLLVFLPLVRFSFPLSFLTRYGYTVWVGTVILMVVFMGSVILKSATRFPLYMKNAFIKVIPALIAMCSLLIVANVMTTTGMISEIANGLAKLPAGIYPMIAVAIGSLGSFMTGTGMGSNVMFGGMHVEVASTLNLNPITVFAGQNSGAAIGNMICPNNVVAASTTVNMPGKEGEIIKRVFPGFLVLFTLYSLLSILYTMVIFA